jgi:uncharacterized membrane protein
MKLSKKDLLILIVPFLILAVIYPILPASIPRQFHFNGQPTSYMDKEFIFLFGFLPILIYSSYKRRTGRG